MAKINQRGKLLLKSILKGLSWAALVTLLAAIPLFLTLLVGSINPDVMVGFYDMLKTGAILFIGTALSGAAWVDILYSKVKPTSTLRIVSNVIFISILLFSSVIFATTFSATTIVYSIVLKLSVLIVAVGFIFSWGIKSLLFHQELLDELEIAELKARILELENKIRDLEYTDYVEIDDSKEELKLLGKRIEDMENKDDKLDLEVFKKDIERIREKQMSEMQELKNYIRDLRNQIDNLNNN